MGYYITKEDGLIQASLAERIGKLLSQYEAAKPEGSNERYDATLTLVLAQALLTSCYESLMRDDLPQLRDIKGKKISDVPSFFGLQWKMVKLSYPSQEQPNFYQVVEHLRHAVSHPLFPTDEGMSVKITGFMAIKNTDGNVAGFKFIHSEDIQVSNQNAINRNVIIKSRTDTDDTFAKKITQQVSRLKLSRDDSKKLVYVPFHDKTELHFDGRLLMRVFELDVPVENLKIFVRELSSILSAPLKECSKADAEAIVL